MLDASDNFATRHAINRACVAQRKPLVSGAAVRFDGQVSVFDLRDENAPCYHCLFPESSEADEMRCAENGVFAPLVGTIGSTQAAEAMKLIVGCGETLSGQLLLLNSLTMEWRSLRLKARPRLRGLRQRQALRKPIRRSSPALRRDWIGANVAGRTKGNHGADQKNR